MLWIFSELLSSSLVYVGFILLLIYYYGTSTYNFWKKKGIPHIKPKYPFLGTQYELVFSMKSIPERQLEVYNSFKDQKFCGLYYFRNPAVFVKDPELIHTILIKDFSSVPNRGLHIDTKSEPLSTHLVNLEGAQWKCLRQKLTPTFSSGKLKGMHQQLVDCSDELVKYINDFAIKSEPIEAREVMAKFSTDVIGSCAFGINTNALSDPSSIFRQIGRKMLQPTIKSRLRFTIRSQFPGLLKILGWKGLDEATQKFFKSMIEKTISYREKNNIARNDFVQLLMELKKQELENQKNGISSDQPLNIDDNVITSNAFVFFVAGFETTASTLSYCLYELSLNEDIQEEAYQQIVEVLKNHGGELTYDAVKEMKLIHNIFSETLRLHPPAAELRREVVKDYNIPETNVTIPKGTFISFPVYSIHHDPKYYPEPEKFKPKRFANEKENIKKGTFIPFGDGPRICIGKRFAKMEVQVALIKLLQNYRFTLNPKTRSPLVYNPSAFLLVPIGGVWLDVHKRN